MLQYVDVFPESTSDSLARLRRRRRRHHRAIGHVCSAMSVHRLTDQESVQASEVVQSFHLHNNEVGSEVFDCVCLPFICAHVLMDSVLHYFNDLRLITEASITKTQAGLAGWDGEGAVS